MTDRLQLVDLSSGAESSLVDLRRGFKQGYIFELVDIRQPEPLEVHVLVLNPRSYTLTEPFQKTLTPAEDNTVVAEENGIIVRQIVIEGTHGITKKTAKGFRGAQGNGEAISGPEHFIKLRDMFRRYSDLKKQQSESAFIAMNFHSLRDDDHFRISPTSFETPRDAKSARMHYTYRITADAIGEARRPQQQSVDDAGIQPKNTLRAISEAFNKGRAAFAELTAELSLLERQSIGNVDALVVTAGQFFNAVGEFIGGNIRRSVRAINYPHHSAVLLAETIANTGERLVESIDTSTNDLLYGLARSMQRMEAAVDAISMFPDKFDARLDGLREAYRGERRLTTQDVYDGAAGATVGSRTRLLAGVDDSSLDLRMGNGFLQIIVSSTDSTESIAARYSTTPEAIAMINDLRPPYISEGGGPGVAAPGDTILVPTTVAPAASVTSGVRDYEDSSEALYGVDMLIDEREVGFDISVDEAHGSLDAEVVGGIENVKQGLNITISTERGTTVFLPDVGITRTAGARGTIEHTLMTSIVLRAAILSDPRIDSIESLKVVLDGDTLEQEVTPVIAGQRSSTPLILPFGKATG